MVGSGDYNISCAAVFDHGVIVDTTKAWKIEKNSVFCGGCIVYFLEYRFCIHSIYMDSRKKNV